MKMYFHKACSRLLTGALVVVALSNGACNAAPDTPAPCQATPLPLKTSTATATTTGGAETPKAEATANSKQLVTTASKSATTDAQKSSAPGTPKPVNQSQPAGVPQTASAAVPTHSTTTIEAAAKQAQVKIIRSELEKQLRAIAASYSDLEIGISVYDISSGQYAEIRGDRSFPMGSAFRLPILVEAAVQMQSGQVGLTLDTPLTITNSTKSIGSGDMANLPNGSKVTMREALEKMITISDNTATDTILARIGTRSVNQLINELGMTHSSVYLTNRQAWLLSLRRDVPHGETVESFLNYWKSLNFKQKCDLAAQVGAKNADVSTSQLQVWENDSEKDETFAQSSAMASAVDNFGSPNDYTRLLYCLWKGLILDKQWTDYCLGVLSRQQFNNRIPAKLPEGTKVYHKTGTICGVVNDTGIMMVGNRPVAISVFIDQVKPDRTEAASQACAELARATYDFFNSQK